MSELERLFQGRMKERWQPWKGLFWRYWRARLEDFQLRLGWPLWEFIKRHSRLRRLWQILVMEEYFIVANSFAAPFFSDRTEEYVKGKNPKDAMQSFVDSYRHPCGLYSAALYRNADAFHKGQKPLCRWLCNFEIEKEKLTGGKSCTLRHDVDKKGHFLEVNHERHYILHPKKGSIILNRDGESIWQMRDLVKKN